MTDPAAPTPEEPRSFETLLATLEGLVTRLERGEQPLETALADYERGVAVAREASGVLDRAELRLAQLTADGAELSLDAGNRMR
jgi:exodeoxyribonuclease VII small subunit